MPQYRVNAPGDFELINGELHRIAELLSKATVELEHGNLTGSHNVLLSARQAYEALAERIARISAESVGEQQFLTLRLAQCNQAIGRSERRLAVHVRGSANTGADAAASSSG